MATPATLNKARRRQFQSLFDRVTVATVVIDPVTLDANERVDVDVTGMTGVALGDFVLVAPGVDMTEVDFAAHVSAAGTVTISLGSTDANDVNLASSTWNLIVLRLRADLKANG